MNLLCETDIPAPELPSRIIASVPVSRSKPSARNAIMTCDYVTSDESLRETEERFQELLAVTLPKSGSVDGVATGVILREDSAPIVQQTPPQKRDTPSQQSNPQKKSTEDSKNQIAQVNNPQKSFFLPIMVAVVVAVAGVLILLMQK